ncbi:MAG: SDR family NAD(P)-dependent oxidoreductase [Desulfobaccales bacterium]
MIKPQFDLDGKCTLITGACGGIGGATARLFARAGARLFVSDTREEKLRSLCAELEGQGAVCSGLALDANEPDSPARLVAAAVKEMGRLDILVNALGINRPQRPEEVTPENWDAVLNTNLRAVFFLCQAAGRPMIQQQYGRIVNISSQAGSVALPLRAAYCASKAGLNLMTRVLALEWASHNIRVNAVAPTFVETPFVTEMFKEPDFKRYVLDSIPAGRMATVDEVAYAALYLACDFASIVTGHILLVDGGWTIK